MARLTDLIAVPPGINPGLSGTRNDLMLSLLGSPRSSYDGSCENPTNSAFLSRVKWGIDVGPFKVSGFDLAVDSLKQVCADIEREVPQAHNAMGTAGMLCCRMVRGSTAAISNHSWGTAVDIKIDGVLDRRGNGKVQIGLAQIAPIFNRHGWFWGAEFTVEDGMHFEISQEKMLEWHEQGALFDGRSPPSQRVTRVGDRGRDVEELQKRLNQLGAELVADGIFGRATLAAVIDFQGRSGLEPDGIVGRKTWKRLRELTS